MAKLAIGKKRFHFAARGRDIIRPWRILRRQHGDNARHGARRRNIQSPKPPMRDGREQQRAMQHARRFGHIIRKGRAARHMAKR
jgi:hypothetical protein